jgi:3-phosphoshikimate 1-carboxyvinyltransferase
MTSNQDHEATFTRRGAEPQHDARQRDERPHRDFHQRPEERPQRGARPERAPRGERGDRPERGERAERGDRRPPLRDTVADIDKSILKMLVKRYNCIQRMSAVKGHLDPKEEKMLRENWERIAGKMSRDARLIRQMFTLMQEVEFLPRRDPGEELRQGFNLAPSGKPVNVRMRAPVSNRKSRVWLMLAALTGTPMSIAGTLLNDSMVECCKMLNQMGCNVGWQENGTVLVREGGAFALEDKVVYVGDDIFNFALLLGQFLGQHSRAKFTGDSSLKFADLSALRRFLPQLGARLVNALPKSDGFPVRVECSGVLPQQVSIPADVQSAVVEGLLLSAPFWQQSISIDISQHKRAEAMLGFVLPFLQAVQANVRVEGMVLHFAPSTLALPAQPVIPVDLSLTATLLALPALNGGRVALEGLFPQCPIVDQMRCLLAWAGAEVSTGEGFIRSTQTQPALEKPLDATQLSSKLVPLAVAFACFHALRGTAVPMPQLPEECDRSIVASFLEHAGLFVNHEGLLEHVVESDEATPRPEVWTAPTAQWAMALAITSFARAGLKLANAGIMTTLYPSFWALFNSLPDPELKQLQQQEQVHEPVVRRRIITSQPASFRERDSDD